MLDEQTSIACFNLGVVRLMVFVLVLGEPHQSWPLQVYCWRSSGERLMCHQSKGTVWGCKYKKNKEKTCRLSVSHTVCLTGNTPLHQQRVLRLL